MSSLQLVEFRASYPVPGPEGEDKSEPCSIILSWHKHMAGSNEPGYQVSIEPRSGENWEGSNYSIHEHDKALRFAVKTYKAYRVEEKRRHERYMARLRATQPEILSQETSTKGTQ